MKSRWQHPLFLWDFVGDRMAFRCLNLPLYKTIKGVDKRGGASSPTALDIEKVSTRLGALLRPTPGGSLCWNAVHCILLRIGAFWRTAPGEGTLPDSAHGILLEFYNGEPAH